jgi:hypothetical protein
LRRDVDAALLALQAFNPKAAEQRMDDLKGSTAQLADELEKWRAPILPELRVIKSAAETQDFVLPRTFGAQAVALVVGLEAKLQQTSYNRAVPPPLSDLLTAAHEANISLRQLAGVAATDLRSELDQVVRALRAAGKDPSKLATIAAGLPTLDGDVSATQLAHLVQALRETYEQLKPLIQKAEPAQLLAEGRFGAAVVKELTQSNLLSPNMKVTDAAPGVAPETATLGTKAMGAAARLATPAPSPLLIVRSNEERALAQLQELNILRGLVSGALMAVVTWVLYRDSWVGTPGDFTGVAAFAFFSDFTLQSALDAAGKVKKASIG